MSVLFKADAVKHILNKTLDRAENNQLDSEILTSTELLSTIKNMILNEIKEYGYKFKVGDVVKLNNGNKKSSRWLVIRTPYEGVPDLLKEPEFYDYIITDTRRVKILPIHVLEVDYIKCTEL